MSVAVIGAQGFIGRHLVHGLVTSGVEVFPYSSKTSDLFDAKTGAFDPDFRLPPNLDAVVYLSQSPRYRQASAFSQHVYNVNTIGPAIAARVAKESFAKKFIYTSTGNVYAPSFSKLDERAALNLKDIYALSKIHGEQLLASEAGDLKVLCVRLFGVFGPNQTDMLVHKIATCLTAGMPVTLERNPSDPKDSDGIQISYLYVLDLVRILISLISKPQTENVRWLNIAGPRAISLRELTMTLAKFIGGEAVIQSSDRMRQTDLIADISRLAALVDIEFTPFEVAIESVCKDIQKDHGGIV